MVVGRGLVASLFNEYSTSDEVLIFASGVSDSNEQRDSEFKRELDLINLHLSNHPNSLFVYFSTCSVADEIFKNRKYTIHKLAVEKLIMECSSNFLICRLSNLVGFGGNSKNIFNYLVQSVINGKSINIWRNASRSLLDVDDLKSILESVIDSGEYNRIINIASESSYSIPMIIEKIENHFGKKFIGNYIEKGNKAIIDVKAIKKYLENLNQDFSDNYIDFILKKYFPIDE